MRRYRQAKGSDFNSLEREEKDRVPLRAPSLNPDVLAPNTGKSLTGVC